jgi:hypothetical protein
MMWVSSNQAKAGEAKNVNNKVRTVRRDVKRFMRTPPRFYLAELGGRQTLQGLYPALIASSGSLEQEKTLSEPKIEGDFISSGVFPFQATNP